MTESPWTASEKKIARRVFDAAVERELAEILAEFKARAAKAKSPGDMWDVRDYLTRTQRAFDAKYDFRYPHLLVVFGLLLREKRIKEADLKGLAEAKLASIRVVASL